MYPIQLLQILLKFDIRDFHKFTFHYFDFKVVFGGMPLVILYTGGLFYQWSTDARKMPLRAILLCVGNLRHKK